ncbi:DUF2793 domain-containing protein [Novosphingobium sp. TH158]|uniref:DUF2793 domain-containing protein n=1 Tax=Novosphingobium sp. TH158 TaxID=2067455 RepID=UPI000C7DCE13|nr:DUF2793 domain-containing protein [Novosphingobium sp. TH158]PLK27420.1 hypothetical protein C0V78_11370 [Novosphingobium sp. TH158]
MTDPIFLDQVTPRLALPMLFAGQSQKEIFVNEALVRIDALCHCIIEDEIASPPASAPDGTAWLVGSGATGEWAGRDGAIALRQLGQWQFSAPVDGMRITNRATGQVIGRVDDAWVRPVAPQVPSGGATIDIEARATIAELIARLREAGIFAIA